METLRPPSESLRVALWRARADAQRAIDKARRATLRSAALRDVNEAVLHESARLRRTGEMRRLGGGVTTASTDSVRRFVIRGVVGNHPVTATWARGRLVCDEPLLTPARLLVDLEEVFVLDQPPYLSAATLDGSALAVLVTLIRACDRVTGVKVDTSAA